MRSREVWDIRTVSPGSSIRPGATSPGNATRITTAKRGAAGSAAPVTDAVDADAHETKRKAATRIRAISTRSAEIL